MSGQDTDLESMTSYQLRAEVIKLRTGIRAHRDSNSHGLCWFVPELWGLLPEKVTSKPEVPPEDEFLRCCKEYRDSLK